MGFPQAHLSSIFDIAGFGNCDIKKVAGSYRDIFCATMDVEYSDVVNKYVEFHCSAF